MANVSEVGASNVEVQSYQCSIKKITASTKWKAPMADDAETVTATVYDNHKVKEGKTIYVISSQKGTDVTIKTDRDSGKCTRNVHKNYQRFWDEYTVDGKQEDTMSADDHFSAGGGGGGGGGQAWGSSSEGNNGSALSGGFSSSGGGGGGGGQAWDSSKSTPSILDFPIYPYKLIKNPKNQIDAIKSEETLNIKCFEIGGALEAFKYWSLPLSLSQDCITKTKCFSCKEGPIEYKIIAYPDISFKVEVTLGTKMAKLKRSSYDAKPEDQKYEKKYKTSFERKTASMKYVPERIDGVWDDYTHAKKKIAPPTITISTTYNNKEDEIEIKFDTDIKDKDNEFLYGKYKHKSTEIKIGTALFQKFGKTVKKAKDTIELLGKICNLQFLKDFIDFDAADLIKNYKPYKIKLEPPSVSITVEGKYQTSKDLTKIGKYIDIGCAFDPLISISLTIDLLFLILSAVSAGTATGIYMMIKNIDKVLEKVLDKDYKQKYEGRLPAELDIYIDLVLTGSISGNLHVLVNTAEDSYMNMPTDCLSTSESIEGELKVDLKAGIKASVNVLFFVTANGELSASGSSGIKVRLGLVNRILQGEGLTIQFDTVFLGLKLKYCVKGKAGFFKTFSIGGSIEGETMVLEERTIGFLSGGIVLFEDKSLSSGNQFAGNGGGGGGGIAWGPNAGRGQNTSQSSGGGHGGGGGRGW